MGTSGYWQKGTVAKLKHKDHNFPLHQGQHNLSIPIVVPNLEHRPTIQNASLLRCVYHITLKFPFKVAGDFRVRIPIIVGTFPPKLRGRTYDASPTISTLPTRSDSTSSDESVEAPKSRPAMNLINWDVANADQLATADTVTPEISIGTPLQPLPAETSEFGPSLNIYDFMDQTEANDTFMQEFLISKQIEKFSRIGNEFDEVLKIATAGEWNKIPTKKSGVANPTYKEELEKSGIRVQEALRKLASTANGKDMNALLASLKELTSISEDLTDLATDSSMMTEDIGDRFLILQNARQVVEHLEVFALTAKNGMSSGDPEVIAQVLQSKIKEIQNSTAELLSVASKLSISKNPSKSSQAIEELKKQFSQYLKSFNNPFGEETNSSPIDPTKSIQEFSSKLEKFAIACYTSEEEMLKAAQELVMASNHVMIAVKSIIKNFPENSEQILAIVRNAMMNMNKILESALSITTHKNNDESMESLHKSIDNINDQLTTLSRILSSDKNNKKKVRFHEAIVEISSPKTKVEPSPVVVEPNPVDSQLSQELIQALQAINSAATKLQSVNAQLEHPKPTDDVSLPVFWKSNVVEASSSVADAINMLLQASKAAQAERNAWKPEKSRLYHEDPTWSQGLISAAKQVVSLVEELVVACSSEDLKQEVVISLARAIAASTAQLISAERAKADPNSPNHGLLINAAKAVARTTSELLSRAEKSKVEPKVIPEIVEPLHITGSKVKELEVAAKIAKLEQELQNARVELGGVRKQQYE